MKSVRLEGNRLEALAGHLDDTFRLIEGRFGVRISARGTEAQVTGTGDDAAEKEEVVADLLVQLGDLQARGMAVGKDEVRTAVGIIERHPFARLDDHFVGGRVRASARKHVVPKSANQRRYIEAIRRSDLVFGIGPAGTGKTYLAVAMAISMLNERRIQRILLARPAVEAGERLGFLPGDIAAKVDPYLRPLYDALYDMVEVDRIERLLERGTIEIAPLAFMRGRTLNDAFVILDEAQNTTVEQMKMFLTRIGLDSKAVVTGDPSQTDLPTPRVSGLLDAAEVVLGIEGIEVIRFDRTDVVRHPLVQRIVQAYDRRAERAGPRLPLSGGDGASSTPEKGAA